MSALRRIGFRALTMVAVFQPGAAAFADGDARAMESWGDDGGFEAYFDGWSERAEVARMAQPDWSSPLVTTTAMLEQRARFDAGFQQIGNGARAINLDGGKGVDLIISDADEIQVAGDPYIIRGAQTGKGELSGFNDWPALRFKHRLASSPESQGNYVVSIWVQAQFPTGISKLTNHAFTLLPTLGFGKGWGAFDIQGTVGAAIPTTRGNELGARIVSNLALQYHILDAFWPQIEANWTYYQNGPRAGENQVFLTPGVVVGRLAVANGLKFTFGVGYQVAVAPAYRPSPLIPAYDHAWILTTRVSF